MEGDKLLQEGLQRLAQNRVSGDPLPGPLAEAFSDEPLHAGGQVVRKMVLSDWLVLKQVQSPILKLIEEVRQNSKEDPKVDVSDEENFEICYQFTHSPKECRDLLRRGKDVFREAAIEFADANLNVLQVTEIVTAAMEQIRRSWLTTLKYQAEQEKDKINFKGTTPRTASGGG